MAIGLAWTDNVRADILMHFISTSNSLVMDRIEREPEMIRLKNPLAL